MFGVGVEGADPLDALDLVEFAQKLRDGTYGFASGAVLTTGLGVGASIAVTTDVLFPRVSLRARRALGGSGYTGPAVLR